MGRVLLKAVGFILVLLFMASTISGKVTFRDVSEGVWYQSDLDYVLNDSRKMLVGYPDGNYKPSKTLQVDQFIKCLVLAAGHQVTQGDGYWAQNYIDVAMDEGYIRSGEFSDYNIGISRSAMARIVTRVMAVIESPTYSKISEIESNLIDQSLVASHDRESVYQVYELGIITGYPDGTFKPNNTLTRAEATVVLRRIIDKSARKPYQTVVDPYEAHYKGGGLWVDPVTVSDEVNTEVDSKFINSEKLYLDLSGSNMWDDLVSVIIWYDENENPTDQLADLRRLLSRRFDDGKVSLIMEYVENKTGWYEFLGKKEKNFYIDGYTINVVDRVEMEGTPYKRSKSVEILLWK